eukprot:1284632-Rhodomonas_salina.1
MTSPALICVLSECSLSSQISAHAVSVPLEAARLSVMRRLVRASPRLTPWLSSPSAMTSPDHTLSARCVGFLMPACSDPQPVTLCLSSTRYSTSVSAAISIDHALNVCTLLGKGWYRRVVPVSVPLPAFLVSHSTAQGNIGPVIVPDIALRRHMTIAAGTRHSIGPYRDSTSAIVPRPIPGTRKLHLSTARCIATE